MTDIAIVGIDCRFPEASDPAQFWDLMMKAGNVSSEVPPSRWRAEDFWSPDGRAGTVNTTRAGFVGDLDAFDSDFFGTPPREAEAMDPQQRLLVQTVWRAFEDAALDPRAQAGSLTGVFVGIMGNEWANLHMMDYRRITPQLGSGNGQCMTANRVSYQFDLRGPSMAVDTACSSSLVAIQLACAALRAGECDQAVAAGVNVILTPALGIFYTQAGLSAPDARCKPFSALADGIGRCEGVAAVVLRRLDDAQAERLPIYAVIRGGAVNSDGRSNGITAPSRWAQEDVVRQAYRRAKARPPEIAFIEAHGTGTVLGDLIEARALAAVHAVPRPRPCALGSVKGNLGHAEGAAGIAGLIKTALSLRYRIVPASVASHEENRDLRLADGGLQLLKAPMRLPPHPVLAGVSSFGLGGTNAHLVLASPPRRIPSRRPLPASGAGQPVAPGGAAGSRTAEPERDRTATGVPPQAGVVPGDGAVQTSPFAVQTPPFAVTPPFVVKQPPFVVTMSGPTEASLRSGLALLADDVELRPAEWFGQLAWTSNRSRSRGRYRFAVVADDRDAAVEALRAASTAPEPAARPVGPAPSIGWLFTGQGSQYQGMGRALHARSPAFRAAMAEVDEAMRPYLGRSVRSVAFDDDTGLDRTEWAQPALFAVGWALGRSLLEHGAEPAWMVGHSIGEIVAAALAGVFDLDGACKLICVRGRLMGALPAGGGMLAVRAPLAEIAFVVADFPEVSVAAVNGPTDVVLSGDLEALGRLRARLAPTVAARLLTVSHAFHSPLMAPVRDRLAEVAAGIPHLPPTVPIYSTLHSSVVGSTGFSPAYWAEQMVATVRFASAAATALRSDPTHVVEVGPRRVLLPMVSRLPGGAGPRGLAPCPGPDATGRELAATIADLYVDGLDPNWDVLYDDRHRVSRRLSPYRFSTANRYWTTPVRSTADAAHRAEFVVTRAVPVPVDDSIAANGTANAKANGTATANAKGTGTANAKGRANGTGTANGNANTNRAATTNGGDPEDVGVTGSLPPQVHLADVVRLVGAVSGHSPGEIGTDSAFTDDLGFDSIMIMQLAGRVETRWALKVPAQEFVKTVVTVGDLVAFLAKALVTSDRPISDLSSTASERVRP